MIIGAALLSVVVFVLVFRFAGILGVAQGAMRAATRALETARDPSKDDDAKERAAREGSIALFRAFFSILVRSAVVLAAAAAPIFAADALGLARADAVTAMLSRWDVALGIALVLTAGWWAKERLWPST